MCLTGYSEDLSLLSIDHYVIMLSAFLCSEQDLEHRFNSSIPFGVLRPKEEDLKMLNFVIRHAKEINDLSFKIQASVNANLFLLKKCGGGRKGKRGGQSGRQGKFKTQSRIAHRGGFRG